MFAPQMTPASAPLQLSVRFPHLDGYNDRISSRKNSLDLTGSVFNLLYKYTKDMISANTKAKTTKKQQDR